MAGGGQPGNKNAEKWTEEKAIELGNRLIEWMNEKDDNGKDKGNIFFKEFLMQNDVYQDLIEYLGDKFKSFSDLIRKAKQLQELKLIKFGIADRLQPTMTIFVLKNHHNYKDKQDIDHTSKGDKINDLSHLTFDQLYELKYGRKPD